ncbi:MAG: holo-ACP synthase [Candidatus Cloacimonadaceae bacterium]
MIVGIGTDIVAIARIRRILEKNPAFIRKVFSDSEIAYCEKKANKAESYAARFAAKEALMKALGTGWAEKISWKEIQVAVDTNGKPSLELSGVAFKLAQALGAEIWHLSLSHEREYATAFVILEQGAKNGLT